MLKITLGVNKPIQIQHLLNLNKDKSNDGYPIWNSNTTLVKVKWYIAKSIITFVKNSNTTLVKVK